MTDQGFLTEDKVVWESLHNVDGDGNFCDSEFHLRPPSDPETVYHGQQDQIDQVAMGSFFILLTFLFFRGHFLSLPTHFVGHLIPLGPPGFFLVCPPERTPFPFWKPCRKPLTEASCPWSGGTGRKLLGFLLSLLAFGACTRGQASWCSLLSCASV